MPNPIKKFTLDHKLTLSYGSIKLPVVVQAVYKDRTAAILKDADGHVLVLRYDAGRDIVTLGKQKIDVSGLSSLDEDMAEIKSQLLKAKGGRVWARMYQ